MKLSKLIGTSVVAAAVASTFVISAAAETYNAYCCFQTAPYSFRNRHTDATYGDATKYFNAGVIVWGGNDPETYPDIEDLFDYDIEGYVLPATFNDAKIDKDGTYKVGVSDFDWARDGSSGFNLIFLDTDIPADAGVKIVNPKLIVDGEVTVSLEGEPMLNDDAKAAGATAQVIYDPDAANKDNMLCLLFANIWNDAFTSYTGKFPTSTLEIEFTVEGMGGEETPAPESSEETPAPESSEAPVVDEQVKTTVNIHYLREDGNYEGWDLWIWGSDMTGSSDGEKFSDTIDENGILYTTVIDGPLTDFNYIVRVNDWSDREWLIEDHASDEDGNRKIDPATIYSGDAVSGTVDVYVKAGAFAEAEVKFTPASTGTDTPSTPDENKPNSGTGAEGVAVAAGLAVLATGAAIIAKKRK